MLAVARVVADGPDRIERSHLPPELSGPLAAAPTLDDAERETLIRALAEVRGNVSVAAKALGVARSTIHRMKRRHDLG